MTLPGILLSVALMPYWREFRENDTIQLVLKGVNAAAAGLMIAACGLLFLQIVNGSKAKAAAVLAFIGMQNIFKLKAPVLVLTGIVGGVVCAFAPGFGSN